MRNKFVDYLNTLHSYNGHNSNAFGEKNICSEYYKDLLVEIPLCDFIVKKLSEKTPNLIMLTGHAGDGKTSIMYQVLEKLDCKFNSSEDKFEVTLPNGMKCLCIKDFSEFPDSDKLNTMVQSKNYQNEGAHVFMVANTGPLINTFLQTFEEGERNEVESLFIDAMDKNNGETIDIGGYKVCLINIVNTDNTLFADKFLDKIIQCDKWKACESCEKAAYCHIYRNRNLMLSNKNNTLDFVRKHYLWLSEYGTRLTIRSMTQQLAFMFTGGVECNDVKEEEDYKYLYSNLFFGYVGITKDEKAQKILAIEEASKQEYDKKRLRADEKLFIEEDYKKVFSNDVEGIIKKTINNNGNISGLNPMIRRMYFFFNILTDHKEMDYDVFSPQFDRYIELKYKDESPNIKDNELIKNALCMIYTGSIKQHNNDIPITLNRESGYTQNVQFVIENIKSNKIKIVKECKDDFDGCGDKRNVLKLSVDNMTLNQEITLPLFDYFEELKNGILNTNIDAQLSKGIENIKAEILDIVLSKGIDDELSMIVTTSNGYVQVDLDIVDGKIV